MIIGLVISCAAILMIIDPVTSCAAVLMIIGAVISINESSVRIRYALV